MARHGKRWTRWGVVVCAVIWLAACAGTPGATRYGQLAPFATPVPLSGRAAAIDPDAAIERIIRHMTLDQKIGQLLMVEIEDAQYDTASDIVIRQGQVGGVIIYNNVSRTYAQMQQQLVDLQAHATIPLLVATDQEGGDVSRLNPFFGDYTEATSAAALSAANDPAAAKAQGALDAQRMLDLGFNVDLAPVVDIGVPDWSQSLEGTRLWSTNVAQTDKMAGAFLDGLQGGGVIGSLKHWPGLGSTPPCTDPSVPMCTDPDFHLISLNRTASQLQTIDMASFKGLLSHGPAMIMVTAVKVPAFDAAYPADLSPTLVNSMLRGQLGYQGVVITDSLHQGAIYDYFNCYCESKLGDAAVLAVEAGDDVLEGAFDADPRSVFFMENALKAAVQSGRIPLSRIEESDRRILRLKWGYSIGLKQLMKLAGPAPLPATPAATLSPVAVSVADVRG